MESNTPVSVIMPVYNSGMYIEYAIKSILQQTFKDFEFIIINDGSTDNSKEKILHFRDKRIILLDNETNKGIIYSLNRAIDIAKGKYIVRMDADDISLSKRIEKEFAFMEAHQDIVAAGCGYYLFSNRVLKKMRVYTENDILRTMLLFNSCLCHPATIIRKKLLIDNSIRYNEDYQHAEDYDLWIQLSKLGKLSNIQEFLFKYRFHKNQVTKSANTIQKKNADILRLDYMKDLGFTCTEKDYETHTLVATNKLIKEKNQLTEIEAWFIKLIFQNQQLQSITPAYFNFFLGKLWYDSCGMTNLGISSYRRFFRSPLHTYFPLSLKAHIKLLVKCILRRFRK